MRCQVRCGLCPDLGHREHRRAVLRRAGQKAAAEAGAAVGDWAPASRWIRDTTRRHDQRFERLPHRQNLKGAFRAADTSEDRSGIGTEIKVSAAELGYISFLKCPAAPAPGNSTLRSPNDPCSHYVRSAFLERRNGRTARKCRLKNGRVVMASLDNPSDTHGRLIAGADLQPQAGRVCGRSRPPSAGRRAFLHC